MHTVRMQYPSAGGVYASVHAGIHAPPDQGPGPKHPLARPPKHPPWVWT